MKRKLSNLIYAIAVLLGTELVSSCTEDGPISTVAEQTNFGIELPTTLQIIKSQPFTLKQGGVFQHPMLSN